MSRSQAIAMTGTAWGGDLRNTRSIRRKLAHDYLACCGFARRSPESGAIAHQTWRGRVPDVCLGRIRGRGYMDSDFLMPFEFKGGSFRSRRPPGTPVRSLGFPPSHPPEPNRRASSRSRAAVNHATLGAPPNVAVPATKVPGVPCLAAFMGQKNGWRLILQTTL